MVQLLVKESKNWIEIASSLSKELAANAVERDSKAGVPEEEIQLLRSSGLLPFVVPKEYGGIGGTWVEGLKIVQELSVADGSIGQLYGNHLNLTALGHVSGTPEQKDRYYRETAQKNLFWANAINTRDTRLKIAPEGEHFRVNGVKSFGTGIEIADVRVFSALQDNEELPLLFVIPKDREGVVSNQDWNNFGQRRTDSDSFTFNNVLVKKDEILGYPSPPNSAFATFLGIIAQLTKTYVYLGVASGAVSSAKQYTLTETKPWITSGVERATDDPYIQRRYGELWTELQAAVALADRTAIQVQQAWDKDVDLTPEERGEVAVAVFTAKAFISKVGLNIATSIFEVTGTRSTATKYGFDRYWRDLRTFTLHDPVDYKLRDIGNWVLNQELPVATQYS
ncbi:acyl-CoA dehydrogenase family protein [Aetokthonos hydrillicola Thurmond2011]|jgi:alkylation response protein AidB-like acyl-CoA dehydrogenase|uniref:Acyl-CoA dehydrogenase family protein n=1 Tax=Aetokthonos hydrillicola Thurmond2011 TaxID=2712845 RepID=A0AAP5I8M4_9CYAN|nr:acyl-CoA dehydrogenase family protein [Aetokthonos hydrillicola]MBO3462566.1 monooxygenase [Aetokthonos hydrillicola CCALA 1050]MBW4590354.1 acyl-CoA dehydrogenase family protein [Aetokthonos hydrillicola CCALA 1050]MDR9896896.1 acyl-CoA dehydrogenase family protein [Aetokthonos hydrillicola Thurmond2011]